MTTAAALRLAFALAATTTLAACAGPAVNTRFDDQVSHFANYTRRDDSILARRYRDWIRFEYVGPRDAPIDSLWLSPTLFGQRATFNDIMVLAPAAWNRTQLRIAATPCSPLGAAGYSGVVLTIATAGRITQRCIASPAGACDYDAVLRALTLDEVIKGDLEWRGLISDICATGFPWKIP